MRLIWAVLAVVALPGLGLAGAWPREAGATFVSLSFTAVTDPATLGIGTAQVDKYASFYLEHGLTPRLTVGLDAGHDLDGAYSVLAFARTPAVPPDRKTLYALKAGLGQVSLSGGGSDTVVAIGLDIGRGMATGMGDAWLALDTIARYRLASGDTVIKADLTAGLSLSDRTEVLIQLQAGSYPGSDPYLKVVPSVVRNFGDRVSVEFGLVAGVVGDDRVGIKLGTWLEF